MPLLTAVRAGQLGPSPALTFELLSSRVDGPGFQREPKREAVSQPKQHVDGPQRCDRSDRKRRPLRELAVDEPPNELNANVELKLMHTVSLHRLKFRRGEIRHRHD